MTDIEDTIPAFVRTHSLGWQTLLQQFIRTPSYFESEHTIVRQVEQYLDIFGIKPTRVRHDSALLKQLPTAQFPISDVKDRCSLAVRVLGKGGGRSLAINSHLDIVSAGDPDAWTYDPFSGHIDEASQVIYGRGAMDDKAGVVISLALLETLVQLNVPLKGDVVFHYVLEDETTGNGTLLCLEAGFGADAAFIIDGTRSEKGD